MTRERCNRFEQEPIAEFGEPPDQHVASCPDCRAAAQKYERIAALVAGAGNARELPRGWDQRLIARLEVDRQRRRRWPIPLAACVAAAALVVVVVLPRRDGGVDLSRIELVVRVDVAGKTGARATMPTPGDELVVAARTGRWTHAELRLYRDGRELVARCTEAAPCVRKGAYLTARLPLPSAGHYRTLLILGDRPSAAPSAGGMDPDAASASATGEIRIGPAVDVH